MTDEFKVPTQKELKGMETPADKQLTAAAKRYANARDERMAATEKEVNKKDSLIGMMVERKLKRYFDKAANVLILIDQGKAKLKVRIDALDTGDTDE